MKSQTKKRLTGNLILILVLLGSLFVVPIQPAHAATFSVVNTNDSGAGSLRQAIADAAAGDTITFVPSLAGQVIELASELEIDKSVTITGMGLMPHLIISGDTDNDGTGDVQLMTVTPLSTVSIYGIDFVNGKNSPGTNSGGINNLGSLTIYSSYFSDNVGNQGGAIRNSGMLTVVDTVFNDNFAMEGGAILNNPNAQAEIRNTAFNWNSADIGEGGAGAIANLGTTFIFDSNFTQNAAHNGGAIVNSFGGTTNIFNSVFTGNSASMYGGAVYNFEGTTAITKSTFSTNTATYGGAIGTGLFDASYPAITNISESAIINNQASDLAGGILFESGTSTSLDKVTVSGNTAPSAGGILNASYKPLSITNSVIHDNVATLPSYPGGIMSLSSPLTIRNSTITGNSGTGIGAQGDTVISNSTVAGNTGNGLDFFNFTLSITNTILANNGGLDCQNQYGTISLNQNNLVETNSDCGTPMLTSDPNLGPLRNNGGPTQTMALLPGSPAINAGDDATCELTDQRGVSRPQGAGCDIGAYEFDNTPPAVSSIVRANLNPTASSHVDFTVTFSESVTGVDAGDFSVTPTGISGVTVSGVSGSGATRTVTVNTGSGNGTIRLDLTDDDSITDMALNPLGGAGTGNGDFTGGETYTINKTKVIKSQGTNDGWILESTETSGKGGTMNASATTFNLGDGTGDKQYRAILSFDTSSLPDTAVITKVTLKIKKQGLVGADPFASLGLLRVDIRKPFFGSTVGLAITDFQAAAGKNNIGGFSNTPVSNWYTKIWPTNTFFSFISLTGTTQFRLRFAIDDNDNGTANYLKFYSGNAAVSVRPTLIIEYYVP